MPLYNLMEDAATAEICRAQLWQWLRFEAPLDDGRASPATCSTRLFEENCSLLIQDVREPRGRGRPVPRTWSPPTTFEEFLTLPAYELLD